MRTIRTNKGEEITIPELIKRSQVGCKEAYGNIQNKIDHNLWRIHEQAIRSFREKTGKSLP
jgi:hypothetical protein